MNGITAFIDASNVYGSDDELSKNLRSGLGRLLTNPIGPTLPTRNQTNQELHGVQTPKDLVGGDVRAS